MSSVLVEGQSASFFDLYGRGEVSADAIDDYIDRWHDTADRRAASLALHDYLGLTEAEYGRWVQSRGCLPDILRTRRAG